MAVFGLRDFLSQVPFDADASVRLVQIRACNADVDTTLVEIRTQDTNQIQPTVAATRSIVSSDTNDGVGGTGARIVLYKGLDVNFVEDEELVTMNGTTPVITSKSYLRDISIQVPDDAVGTLGGSNIGIISASTGGNSMVEIQPDRGRSENSRVTIPADHVGVIRALNYSIQSGKEVTINMWRHDVSGSLTVAPFNAKRIIIAFDGVAGSGPQIDASCVDLIPEKTDIWADAVGVANNNKVVLNYTIVLRKT